MSGNAAGKTARTNRTIDRIIPCIGGKKSNSFWKGIKFGEWHYHSVMDNAKTFDEKFTISGDCISCGICAAVCPAKNITVDGKPKFSHNCEKCAACIQHCPKRAINISGKTEKRRRYTHPSVGYRAIAQFYE